MIFCGRVSGRQWKDFYLNGLLFPPLLVRSYFLQIASQLHDIFTFHELLTRPFISQMRSLMINFLANLLAVFVWSRRNWSKIAFRRFFMSFLDLVQLHCKLRRLHARLRSTLATTIVIRHHTAEIYWIWITCRFSYFFSPCRKSSIVTTRQKKSLKTVETVFLFDISWGKKSLSNKKLKLIKNH